MSALLRSRRPGRLASFVIGVVCGAVSLSGASSGRQGVSDLTDLQERLTALETQLQSVLALAPHLSVVPDALDGLVGPHVIFEGVNVHVRSGSGRTDDFVPVGGALTGRGNLVVGYNAPPDTLQDGQRGGSHSLVVGDLHRYSSWGGFVAGRENGVSGPGASVSGGTLNGASGADASVSGGRANGASGAAASVSGGFGNGASAAAASVTGGSNNNATAANATVTGGDGNVASQGGATVGGGTNNTANVQLCWRAESLNDGC
jgi:hypothetical protein